jgi:methyl-accepting chemotaxis protein
LYREADVKLFNALRIRDRSSADALANLEQGCQEAILASRRLDDEIGIRLNGAVEQTETSSLAIMSDARALCDRSSALLERMREAQQHSDQIKNEMHDTVEMLVQMTEFLQSLPKRMQRDIQSIAKIAEQIHSLSDLAHSVQALSTQSHMLSINAAIEASRSGEQGKAFKVIASEVRSLAANSHSAAARIRGTLGEIQATVRDELGNNTAQSVADIERIAATAETVKRLRENLDHVRHSGERQYSDMIAHGEELAMTTANMLGHLQIQDVVRQCVDRIQGAIGRRNAALAVMARENDDLGPHEVAEVIEQVVADYLEQEECHLVIEPDLPAMELF